MNVPEGVVVKNRCVPCSAFTPKELTSSQARQSVSWSKQELRVFFKATERKSSQETATLEKLPDPETVLKWANIWHEEAAKSRITVPKFVQAIRDDESDICTEIKGYYFLY